jgi:hypothetical protein
MAANPHPCWSLAQSQLPLFENSPSVSPPAPLLSSRQHNIYLHTDDTNMPDPSAVRHNNVFALLVPTSLHLHALSPGQGEVALTIGADNPFPDN